MQAPTNSTTANTTHDAVEEDIDSVEENTVAVKSDKPVGSICHAVHD